MRQSVAADKMQTGMFTALFTNNKKLGGTQEPEAAGLRV